MLDVLDETSGDLVAIRVSGRHLTDEAHKLASLIDARIEAHGHACAFVEIDDTDGVSAGALKEGLEFDLQHGKQIKRCAIVGDASWERGLVRLLGLFFTNAEVRFFGSDERATALEWASGS